MPQFLLPLARFLREFSRGVHTGHAIRHSRRSHSATGAALERPRQDPRQPSVEAVAASSVTSTASAHPTAPAGNQPRADHPSQPPTTRPTGSSSAPGTESPAAPSAEGEPEAAAGAGPAAEAADPTTDHARPEPGTGTSEAPG